MIHEWIENQSFGSLYDPTYLRDEGGGRIVGANEACMIAVVAYKWLINET